MKELSLGDTAPEYGDRDASLGGRVLDRSPFMAHVRRLSAVDNARAYWAVARQWIIILAAGGTAVWSGHWAVYVVAALVITTRQHALLVLMHDATHYRLFTNRFANDLVSDVFCSLPVGISTAAYRAEHIAHHRFTNSDADPYWRLFQSDNIWNWPKTPREGIRILIRDLIGLNIPRNMRMLCPWSPWPYLLDRNPSKAVLSGRDKAVAILFMLGIIGLLVVTGDWLPVLLLWILPSMSVLVALVRIRTNGEHLVVENEHELNSTRHVNPHFWEKLTLAPLNINYHIAHHLFPSVPYYNLPRLQALLLKDETFRRRAHITSSYTGLRQGVWAEELLISQSESPSIAHPVRSGG